MHDLLLTDPPYGIGERSRKADTRIRKNGRGTGKGNYITDYGKHDWDVLPSKWIIDCAIEKCKLAIVWGGNYFQLPPSRCWLVWDKENSGDFADCEIAWTNLPKAVRIYKHLWNGMIRKHQEVRFHPTQKPQDVMSWCIAQAGEVSTILDPFAGSGTTLVAAKLRNIKSTGIEREERYCEIIANRLSQEVLSL
jgi:DNA modification methylase